MPRSPSPRRIDAVRASCARTCPDSRDDEPPLLRRPGPRIGSRFAHRAHDLGPLLLIVVIAGQPATGPYLRAPREDVGFHALEVVTGVQVNPVERSVREEA